MGVQRWTGQRVSRGNSHLLFTHAAGFVLLPSSVDAMRSVSKRSWEEGTQVSSMPDWLHTCLRVSKSSLQKPVEASPYRGHEWAHTVGEWVRDIGFSCMRTKRSPQSQAFLIILVLNYTTSSCSVSPSQVVERHRVGIWTWIGLSIRALCPVTSQERC